MLCLFREQTKLLTRGAGDDLKTVAFMVLCFKINTLYLENENETLLHTLEFLDFTEEKRPLLTEMPIAFF
jgi:hypothetical protein